MARGNGQPNCKPMNALYKYSGKNKRHRALRRDIRRVALCLTIVAGGWVAGAAGMLIYILFTA